MSWDPGDRTWTIKSKKDKLLEIEKILKPVVNRNKKYFITQTIDDIISIEEQGAYKYGYFGSRCTYNFDKLITEIMDTSPITSIRIDEWEANYTFFWQDGEIVRKSDLDLELESTTDKKDIIEKCKNDFDFFSSLDENIRNDYDIQLASLQSEYSHWTWEFGTEDCDKYYTDEFLDHEEVVREIFKYGGRYNLFKNRVKDKYKNKELMKELLPLQPGYIACLDEDIKSDKELVLKLINCSNNWDSRIELKNVSKKLANDKKVVLNFIKLCPYNIEYASERLKNDYDVCKLYLECGGYSLSNVYNKEILDDKEIMLKYIKEYGHGDNFEYISENLKNDPEVMREMLIKTFSSNENKKGYYENITSMSVKDMILYVMENGSYFNLYASKIIPKSMYDDKDFILKTIEINKKMYSYRKYSIILGKNILDDKEFMKEIDKKKVDYDIDTTSLSKKDIIKHIKHVDYHELNEELKKDCDIIKMVLRLHNYYCFFDTFSPKILEDEEIKKIVFEQIHINGNSEYKIIKQYTDFNRDDLLLLLTHNGDLLNNYEEYLNDKEMVLKAVHSFPLIYLKLKKKLKNDIDILKELAEARVIYGDIKTIAKELQNVEIIKNDKELAIILKKYYYLFPYLSDELKKDDEVIKAYEHIDNLAYFPKKYQEDKEFILRLLKHNISANVLKEFPNKKMFEDEGFVTFICDKKNGGEKKNIVFASDRLKYNVDFVTKTFGLKVKKDNYIDLYIYLFKMCDILDKDLLNNIRYLREYFIKKEYINSLNDYPECETPKELILKVLDNIGKCFFAFPEYITDDLIKDRDFIVKLLNKIDIKNSYFAKDDRLEKEYINDTEIMELYGYKNKHKKISTKKLFSKEDYIVDKDDEEDNNDKQNNEFDDKELNKYPYDDSDVTEEDLKVNKKADTQELFGQDTSEWDDFFLLDDTDKDDLLF